MVTPSLGQPIRWKYAYRIGRRPSLINKLLLFKGMHTELAIQFMLVGQDRPMTDDLHGHWNEMVQMRLWPEVLEVGPWPHFCLYVNAFNVTCQFEKEDT